MKHVIYKQLGILTGLTKLITMGSISDILRDYVGVLSTSNNLAIYCLQGEDLFWQFLMAVSNMICY